MPNINLIAARREEKRRMEQWTRNLFFVFGGAVGVFIVVGSMVLKRRIELSGDIEAANIRMQKIQPILDNIDQIKKDTAEKQPKVQQLETAQFATLRWSALFQTLSQAMPPDTWLISMSAPEGDPMVVTLSGITLSQSTAGRAASTLSNQPWFAKVDVQSAAREGGGGTPGVPAAERVTFTITAQMKPLTPATPGAASGGQKTAQAAQEGNTDHV